MRSRLWILIGEANVGKSTTIAHLIGDYGAASSGTGISGKGKRKDRDVPLHGGGFLRLQARRSAFQENKKDPSEAVEILRNGPQAGAFAVNYLCCLRNLELDGYPGATEYLKAFTEAGLDLVSLVVFDSQPNSEKFLNWGVPVLMFDERIDVEADKNRVLWRVSRVRDHFGWA